MRIVRMLLEQAQKGAPAIGAGLNETRVIDACVQAIGTLHKKGLVGWSDIITRRFDRLNIDSRKESHGCPKADN